MLHALAPYVQGAPYVLERFPEAVAALILISLKNLFYAYKTISILTFYTYKINFLRKSILSSGEPTFFQKPNSIWHSCTNLILNSN